MNLAIVNSIRNSKINKINFQNKLSKQNLVDNSIKNTNNNYAAPIYFTSNLRQNSGLEDAFNDFSRKIQEAYGDIKISELVDGVMREENIIGEGSAKIVYRIPDIEGYVIGREKRIPYSKQELSEIEIPFDKYNFGQPIAQNDSGIIIMKKVEGTSHSLDNWSEKVDHFLFGQPVDKKDAQEFLEAMKKVSKMPISAYINLANQIKYLSDNGHRMDILSPNNVLIDSKNQQMNLIDLIDGQDRFADFDGELNTLFDLENILCGTILHEASRKQLSKAEACELDKATIETLKKCKIAGNYVGLSDDKTNTIRFYNVMDSFVSHFLGCKPKFHETYLEFADRYQNYI